MQPLDAFILVPIALNAFSVADSVPDHHARDSQLDFRVRFAAYKKREAKGKKKGHGREKMPPQKNF